VTGMLEQLSLTAAMLLFRGGQVRMLVRGLGRTLRDVVNRHTKGGASPGTGLGHAPARRGAPACQGLCHPRRCGTFPKELTDEYGGIAVAVGNDRPGAGRPATRGGSRGRRGAPSSTAACPCSASHKLDVFDGLDTIASAWGKTEGGIHLDAPLLSEVSARARQYMKIHGGKERHGLALSAK